MSTQRDLFSQAGVAVIEPEPLTSVRLGNRERQVKLAKKRRETLERAMEVFAQLEGKDVFIEHDDGCHGHFSLYSLKLGRLRVDASKAFGEHIPMVIWLRGSRGASVRIFTDRLVNLRRQDYFGYTLWLLDFWNGFGEYPLDPYRKSGYDCLQIVRFND